MFMLVSATFLGKFGQQSFIPEPLHGSPLLAVPPAAVLLFMAYWLVRLRFRKAVGRLLHGNRFSGREAPVSR